MPIDMDAYREWERNFVRVFSREENERAKREEAQMRANPSPSPCSVYISAWNGEGKVGDVVVRGVCYACGWPPDDHYELGRNQSFDESLVYLRNALDDIRGKHDS